MARSLLLILLFALTVAAYAKPRHEKPAISCTDLWPAVTETLADASNYKIMAQNNEAMRANFIVVGALFPNANTVQLKPRDAAGCELQLRIGFTGADDEAAFRTRVKRTLRKLDAARAEAHQVLEHAQ